MAKKKTKRRYKKILYRGAGQKTKTPKTLLQRRLNPSNKARERLHALRMLFKPDYRNEYLKHLGFNKIERDKINIRWESRRRAALKR